MRMRGLKPYNSRAIGSAILAVEQQIQHRISTYSAAQARQKESLFKLLDDLRGPIFAGITKAAHEGRRKYHPASLPKFKEGCDEIFGVGFGIFSVDMLNDWLYSRDLKHLFVADDAGIRW